MKKSSIYILIFGILLLSLACEKEVKDIRLPQASSKLVVTSFISPQDTLLRVSVVKSVPAIGKNRLSSDNVMNVGITISDEERTTIQLFFNETERMYTAETKNFPIIPGRTYSLKVTHPEGQQLEASCTVPITQNNTLEVTVDSANSRYGDPKEYFMLMKWQDTPDEVNYYRVFGEIRIDQGSTHFYYQPVYFYENELFSDNRLDGARFSSPKAPIWKPSSPPGDPVTNVLYAYLLNTDEHYYRYHQSVNNSRNDNPFAEPVLIYSNVSGGLGVFAAYNRTTVAVDLK